MNVPFSTEEFFNVLSAYNTSTWFMQIIFFVAAVAVTYYLVNKRANIAAYFLAVAWIWTGVAYHLFFFTSINPAATIFGGLFIVQGLLMAYLAYKKKLMIDMSNKTPGLSFILFALLLYPLLGLAFGHIYPAIPIFPLPCPLLIYTYGVLMIAKPPRYTIVIPTLWALIGFTAVMNFGVYQDVSLLISAVIGNVVILKKGAE